MLINILQSGVIDDSGLPLENGKVFVYKVGTLTPVPTFEDNEMTIPHPHPIILNTVGIKEVYVGQDVRLVIETAEGDKLYDIDSVGSVGGLSGTTQIGSDPSDQVIFIASVIGNIIPALDNLYTIGSSTLRWAAGHFVNLFTSTLNGIRFITETIFAGGATTPNWISNLQMRQVAGTFTVAGADDLPLSNDNKGYFSSVDLLGKWASIKCSASGSFDDALGASPSLTTYAFGVDDSIDSPEDVTFWLYGLNKNNTDCTNTDGGSVFAISRKPTTLSPSSTDDIGCPGSPAVADTFDLFYFLTSVTKANYLNQPIQILGRFRMRWDATLTDWTLQAFNGTDGMQRLNENITTKDANGFGEFFYGVAIYNSTKHFVDPTFANKSWKAVQRPTGTTVGEIGIATTPDSASVTSGTPTFSEEDMGVTARITTTGRKVFVGLQCDASEGTFTGNDLGITGSPSIGAIVRLKRNGTTIAQTRIGMSVVIAGAPGPTTTIQMEIPLSSVWYLDAPSAGTHDYTCTIQCDNTTLSFNADDLQIVAYEL